MWPFGPTQIEEHYKQINDLMIILLHFFSSHGTQRHPHMIFTQMTVNFQLACLVGWASRYWTPWKQLQSFGFLGNPSCFELHLKGFYAALPQSKKSYTHGPDLGHACFRATSYIISRSKKISAFVCFGCQKLKRKMLAFFILSHWLCANCFFKM